MTDMNQQIIEEFRANDGKVGGWFANNALVLRHTVGAKSGKEHVNPLGSFEDGDRIVVVASKGGAPTHPDWYHNLVANPEVTVEYGAETFKARASITDEPERTVLYEKMENTFPTFTEYKEKAGRVIPVVTLTRLA